MESSSCSRSSSKTEEEFACYKENQENQIYLERFEIDSIFRAILAGIVVERPQKPLRYIRDSFLKYQTLLLNNANGNIPRGQLPTKYTSMSNFSSGYVPINHDYFIKDLHPSTWPNHLLLTGQITAREYPIAQKKMKDAHPQSTVIRSNILEFSRKCKISDLAVSRQNPSKEDDVKNASFYLTEVKFDESMCI